MTSQYPELEKIEAENISLLTERYSILSLRRLADDSDDLALSLGIPLPTSSASLLPSFLPPTSQDQAPQSLLRQSRRQTRLSRFPPSTLNSAEDQGLLTDEELSGDLEADYRAAKEDLGKRVEGLFSDVGAEDFRDPNVGLGRRFAVWRRDYAEDYEGAFGGLGMVSAWEFWARGEMGDWDPLRVSSSPPFPFLVASDERLEADRACSFRFTVRPLPRILRFLLCSPRVLSPKIPTERLDDVGRGRGSSPRT